MITINKVTADEEEPNFIPAGGESGDHREGETGLKNTWRHTLRRSHLHTHTHTHQEVMVHRNAPGIVH